MLDAELGRLHRGDRFVRLHDVLGDAAEGAPRVPAAPVAGTLLVGRVQRKARRVAEIGQQQHRRARQMGLDYPDHPVAEHPRALPEQDAGSPRQPAIDLGHDPTQRLLAHQDGADRVLVLAQSLDDPAGMAAGNAEDHLDPGLFEHPRHERVRRHFLGQHRRDRHDLILPRLRQRQSLPCRPPEHNAHRLPRRWGRPRSQYRRNGVLCGKSAEGPDAT